MTETSVLAMRDFATRTVLQAGTITRSYFDASYTVETKADQTFVTQVDTEVDQYIRACIEETYPDHGILSEELDEKPSEDAFRWIIDPIDGTFSFVSGIPFYSILLALQKDGESVFGVVYFPELHKLVVGHRDHGAYVNNRKLHPERRVALKDALVLTADPAILYAQNSQLCTRLLAHCGAFRTWADAYAYVLLAEGKADLALDYGMKLWDVAALLPILQEAGVAYSLEKTDAGVYNLVAAAHNDLLQEVLHET